MYHVAISKEEHTYIKKVVAKLNVCNDSKVKSIFTPSTSDVITPRSFILGCIKNQVMWLKDDGHI